MVDNKRKEDEPKIMIFSLYAIQSFYFGFYSSLPLTYSSIPDYQTLSIFALAGIPYSCKFLMGIFVITKHLFRSYIIFDLMEKEKLGLLEASSFSF
jgi:hypothetical protein